LHLYFFNLRVHLNCRETVTNIAEKRNQSPEDLSHCCWWITVVLSACSLTCFLLFLHLVFRCHNLHADSADYNKQKEQYKDFYQWLIRNAFTLWFLLPASLTAFTGICTATNKTLRNELTYPVIKKCYIHFLYTFRPTLYLIPPNLLRLKTQPVFSVCKQVMMMHVAQYFPCHFLISN